MCLRRLGRPTGPVPGLRQVILFTGHTIDKPDRKAPRFPASAEPLARAAIEKEVRQLLESRLPAAVPLGLRASIR